MSQSAKRMASLRDLIERLARVIKEREEALKAAKDVLNRLERMASDFPPDALDILDKALAEDNIIERSIAMLEPKRQRGVLTPRDMALAIKGVILEAGRPMKRGEIVQELEKTGVPVTGKDKNKNIGTIIWRHPELFVRVGDFGYWVKGLDLSETYKDES